MKTSLAAGGLLVRPLVLMVSFVWRSNRPIFADQLRIKLGGHITPPLADEDGKKR